LVLLVMAARGPRNRRARSALRSVLLLRACTRRLEGSDGNRHRKARVHHAAGRRGDNHSACREPARDLRPSM
jgi:hypothetical protein